MLQVVDSVGDDDLEIHVEKARQANPDVQIGETVEQEIDPAYLGRIAAQTARQAIMQRIRQFEKDRIYDDYKDTVGDIVTGTVRRRERGDLVVDLGKAEAILPPRERVSGEDYALARVFVACCLRSNRPTEVRYHSFPINLNFVRRSLSSKSPRSQMALSLSKRWRASLAIAQKLL